MLRRDLRERIKALKTIIPEEIDARTDAVVDLRSNAVVDLSETRDETPQWIDDEHIVDVTPAFPPPPTRGLGTVPPSAADVFQTLDRVDRELAHLISAGMSDEEISLILDMPPGAVDIAVRSLLSMTGYSTRPELINGWHSG